MLTPSLYRLRRRSGALAWALVGMLVLFPLSAHAVAGVLLCFEEDGRIEIESGWAGDCAEGKAPREAHAPLPSPAVEADCAEAPCIDVMLLASPHDGQHVRLEEAATVPVLPLSSVPVLPALWTPSVPGPALSPPSPPMVTLSACPTHPADHASVVLRS